MIGTLYLSYSIVDEQHAVKITSVLVLRHKFVFNYDATATGVSKYINSLVTDSTFPYWHLVLAQDKG